MYLSCVLHLAAYGVTPAFDRLGEERPIVRIANGTVGKRLRDEALEGLPKGVGFDDPVDAA